MEQTRTYSFWSQVSVGIYVTYQINNTNVLSHQDHCKHKHITVLINGYVASD